MRSAVRWQIFTLCYTVGTIVIVALVMGSSQAMKTAWVEDILSMLPQISFLVALAISRKQPTREFPFGWHRAMAIGYLIAGFALLAVGGTLAYESASGLIAGDTASIETVELWGMEVWFGWIMIAVMAIILVGPVFLYGPAKSKLAPVLHSKLLYADAAMARADWQTNIASIIGVAGIGLGIWWLDGAAALFISLGIIWDGFKNTVSAITDLMDRRARRYDGEAPHPLRGEVLTYLDTVDWVADAALRIRDEGHVFHIEVFIVPRSEHVSLDLIESLQHEVSTLNWMIEDVVIVPGAALPHYGDQAERARDERGSDESRH